MFRLFKTQKNRDTPKPVEGQTTEEECCLLFDLARQVQEGCIIEVGSFRGKSTIALAKGIIAGNPSIPLYAIDPHESFTGILGGRFGPQDRKAFFQNVLDAGVVEVVHLVNLSSKIVAPSWDRKIALLWIDGDHTYEGVKRDFELWEPHLLSNAKVAFHDSLDHILGPFRLIAELAERRRYDVVVQLGMTTVIKRNL